jgi:hypothetical protein
VYQVLLKLIKFIEKYECSGGECRYNHILDEHCKDVCGSAKIRECSSIQKKKNEIQEIKNLLLIERKMTNWV